MSVHSMPREGVSVKMQPAGSHDRGATKMNRGNDMDERESNILSSGMVTQSLFVTMETTTDSGRHTKNKVYSPRF